MDRLHEEEVLGKAYDWKLMKRLLKYARPYWALLTVSILLLIVITGLELLNPYLVKIAIDDHISGYNRPLVQVPLEAGPIEDGIVVDNHIYVLKEEYENTGNYPVRSIVQRAEGYYLVDADDPSSPGELLSQEDYGAFRSRDIEGLDRVAKLFAAVILLTFLLSYLQIYILNYTSQKIIFNIREDL
ncbi:MAG TPA: hypothetical protein VFD79_04145, partial [Tissierellaceae bacterium]|nr:hypothetical protein [Tissierellaceae bacterium]